MKNEIKILGVSIPRDEDDVAHLIDEALTRGGCEGQKFFFTTARVTTCKKRGYPVSIKRAIKDGVILAVSIRGNQAAIGKLSPVRDGSNHMTMEQIERIVSLPKPPHRTILKANPETTPIDPMIEPKSPPVEKTPYLLDEVSDPTFVELFHIFLIELFEGNKKPKTAAEICESFNNSTLCDDKRSLNPRRVARILSNLIQKGVLRKTHDKPFGIYVLAEQQPASPTNVSVSRENLVQTLFELINRRKKLDEEISVLQKKRTELSLQIQTIKETVDIRSFLEELEK